MKYENGIIISDIKPIDKGKPHVVERDIVNGELVQVNLLLYAANSVGSVCY